MNKHCTFVLHEIETWSNVQALPHCWHDQPYITRGCYREFYQCDFDTAEDYDMIQPLSN